MGRGGIEGIGFEEGGVVRTQKREKTKAVRVLGMQRA